MDFHGMVYRFPEENATLWLLRRHVVRPSKRYENIIEPYCNKRNPTLLRISSRTSPFLSLFFIANGYNRPSLVACHVCGDDAHSQHHFPSRHRWRPISTPIISLWWAREGEWCFLSSVRPWEQLANNWLDTLISALHSTKPTAVSLVLIIANWGTKFEEISARGYTRTKGFILPQAHVN